VRIALICLQLSSTAPTLPSISPGPSPIEKPVSIQLPTFVTESTLMASWQEGPNVKALNYTALLTSEDVHADLDKTVQDLGQWLNCLDVGLGSLLSFVPSTGM
jgi:hypothetical protein